jgi:hypothetical protein
VIKFEEVVIKFEETVIKTSQRMTAIEAHFPDLKFSVMKIEVFSEGLYPFICFLKILSYMYQHRNPVISGKCFFLNIWCLLTA